MVTLYQRMQTTSPGPSTLTTPFHCIGVRIQRFSGPIDLATGNVVDAVRDHLCFSKTNLYLALNFKCLSLFSISCTNMAFLNKIGNVFVDASVMAWDNAIFIMNLVSPKLKPGEVVPDGAPGHGLKWPEYVPPREGDSRSACPMLNAMANHGILPHDGKNISFKEMNSKIRSTFNFAASFCFFVPNFSARYLNKSYANDNFDLADLSLHASNAIEHDASLTRQDAALVPDQGKPDLQLVDELLKEATGKMPDGSPQLTIPDLSRALSRRRADARKSNKDYSESFFHNMFGSAK